MNLKTLAAGFWTLWNNKVERTLIYTVVATLLTFVGVSNAKQTQVLTLIGAVSAAALLAHGYQSGKEAEGTVPAGNQSAGGGVNINLQSADLLPMESTAIEKLATVSPGSVPPTASPGVAGKILGAVLLVACLVSAGGCANATPISQVTVAYEAYTASVDVLTAAKTAGLITPQLSTEIEPALNAIEAALSSARQAAMAGNQTAEQTAIAEAQAATVQLKPYLNQLMTALAKSGKPPK